MRIHYSRAVIQLLRRPEHGDLRDMLRSLLEQPRPDWTEAVPERPGYRDFYFAGHRIIYVIDESRPETVIIVTLAE